MNIYREMYKKAEPSADIDDLMAKGVTSQPNWFRNYYLPKEEFEEIFDRKCKEFKLSKREKEKVSFEIFLGAGPSSVRPPEWDEEENE